MNQGKLKVVKQEMARVNIDVLGISELIWVDSESWWWTGRPDVLRLMGTQRVGHDWVTELNWTELKWTGMSDFNSDDHYTYYCGQESLRRNGVPIIANKRFQNAVLGGSLKNDRMISLCFQAKPFNIMVIQVYAPTSNAEEAEVDQFYEDLQDFLELTPKKDFWVYISL